MIRRNVRLRKEYIHRKTVDEKEAQLHDKKLMIKGARAQGKSIPTELRKEEPVLSREMAYDDERTFVPLDARDDEYSSGRSPKICVTTSRDPSSRLKAFAKEIKLLFPSAQRVNRGNLKVSELVEVCRSHEFTDVICVQETRGEPDGLIISHLPFGPTAYFTLRNCVARHDIEGCSPMSEAIPHIILHNMDSKLGLRVGKILKNLFPVPKPDTKRVCTFSCEADLISFRHHMYEKRGKEVTLQEVGPRFDMQLYKLRLGTMNESEADNEYVLRPFLNSAKRKRTLSMEPKAKRDEDI